MNSPNGLTSTFHQSARAFCSHGGSTTIRETKVKPHAIFGALAVTAALFSLAAQAQTAGGTRSNTRYGWLRTRT